MDFFILFLKSIYYFNFDPFLFIKICINLNTNTLDPMGSTHSKLVSALPPTHLAPAQLFRQLYPCLS